MAYSDRRSVQFWVESGALVPSPETDHAGRGRHRAFSRSEVIVACVLSAVSRAKLPIGRLIKTAKAFRDNFLVVPETRAYIEAAIAGTCHVFVAVMPGREVETRLIARPTEADERGILGDLISSKRRSDSGTIVFYLNPWFESIATAPK